MLSKNRALVTSVAYVSLTSFVITVGAGKTSRMADVIFVGCLESEAGYMSLILYGLE
jgi:hypothetical protein